MTDLNDKEQDIFMEFSKNFFMDTMSYCRKENKLPAEALAMLIEKVLMCQVITFSFMASIRKTEHVASIYADMKKVSLKCLDKLLAHPEILTCFDEMSGSEPSQGSIDTVELFKSLHKAKGS